MSTSVGTMDVSRVYYADGVNSTAFNNAVVKQLQAMGLVTHDHTDIYTQGQAQVYVHYYRKV
jgi:predicted oxidoreductase